MDFADRVRGLFELTRPMNSFAAGVLTFIGAFVANGVGEYPVLTGAAVAATWFATAAGMAINDYFDRDIDRINNPERAIPRGAVTPREALAFSIALFLGAVVCVLILPPLAIAIAAVNLLALVAYTKLFKGLPGVGNAVVAYLTGSTFLFGGAAVHDPSASAILFALAAISTLTREIIKDVEDVAGDREEGLNTLPIAIGSKRALHLGTALLVVAVVASPFPYVLGIFGVSYLLLVIPADLLMLHSAYKSYRDPSVGQSYLKYGMFLATLAFIAGRLVS